MVLLAEQTRRIEETLWVTLRMFEERKNLLNKIAGSRSEGMTVPPLKELKNRKFILNAVDLSCFPVSEGTPAI
jgi:hypothetical protein